MRDQLEKTMLEADADALHKMGYAQELSRRMRSFSNFAVAFSIICVVSGGLTTFQSAYSAGGGFATIIGWTTGGIFALIVGASMAQIASAYPTAGGLYHWSSILGGRAWGWVTAWFNLLGLIFVCAGINVGTYNLIVGLFFGNILNINTSSWGFEQQTLAMVLITTGQALFNHFGIKITSKLIDISGVLIFVVAVLLALTMILGTQHWDFSRLVAMNNFSGNPGGGVVPHSDNYGYLFLLALLYPLYTMTGFDGSAHTAEETINPRVNVPKGILNSVFWSLVFGLVLAASIILAMPDPVKGAALGGNVVFSTLAGLAVPTVWKDLLYVGILICNFLCGLACVTSTSRMAYAFARDGGLPGSKWLKQVDHKHRSPVAAIWFVAAAAIATTLYSSAFAALTAGAAMFLFISYTMPTLAGLFAEGKSWTEFGPFRLGVFSKPLAIISVLGGLLIIYIGTRPPNNILDSYFIGLLVLLAVAWYGYARKHFPGPPISAAEIAARGAEIATEEAALKGDVDYSDSD